MPFNYKNKFHLFCIALGLHYLCLKIVKADGAPEKQKDESFCSSPGLHYLCFLKLGLNMKQSTIKTIGNGIIRIVIGTLITINSYAQQPDSELLKMMPEIPTEINEPGKRAEYLSLHFWDKFDFSDTTFLMTNHMLERFLVDYLDLLSLVSNETMQQSIHSLLKKSEVEPSTFFAVLSLSEKYLYEPTSPVCNEEKLIPFLQYALQSPLLDDTKKIRPGFLFENVMKNRIGSLANDFTYTLQNGESSTFHTINASYTLLYFNDPECEDCMMLIKQLAASPTIDRLIKENKLKILTVYINDDLEAWKKHASDVPDTWIYSRDAEQKINLDGIYNIKQFPTIYLLDKDKKILLKDTTFEILENYFKNLN